MKSHPIIDYEPLVSAYMGNLTTKLRGFSPAEENEFLETWVPDEDHLRSILGIVEAAKEAGLTAVTVQVGRETCLEPDTLRTEAARFGDTDVEITAESLKLTVSFTKADLLTGINPIYRKGLQAVGDVHEYDGTLKSESDSLLVEASNGPNLKLTALIGKNKHYVVKATRYSGAASDLERRLLERLCRLMEGKPILECSDHAVIELEHDLRDHSQAPPVPGVVMPENGDPMFLLPLHLVRDLLADWRRQTSDENRTNFYVRPSSMRWRGLSQAQRLEEIAVALERFSPGHPMRLTGLETDRRVVLEIPESAEKDFVGSRLLQLEHHLRRTVEPILQIHLQTKIDQNTIRRIKEVRS